MVQGGTALVGSLLVPFTDLPVQPGWFDEHRTVAALMLFLLGVSLLALQFQMGGERAETWLAAVVFESVLVGCSVVAITHSFGPGLVLALVALWTLLRPATRDLFLFTR